VKLRISPWEVLIPFLLCSSSLSALSLPWRLLSFLHGRRSLSFLPPSAALGRHGSKWLRRRAGPAQTRRRRARGRQAGGAARLGRASRECVGGGPACGRARACARPSGRASPRRQQGGRSAAKDTGSCGNRRASGARRRRSGGA
jgi:hypothetical protein